MNSVIIAGKFYTTLLTQGKVDELLGASEMTPLEKLDSLHVNRKLQDWERYELST